MLPASGEPLPLPPALKRSPLLPADVAENGPAREPKRARADPILVDRTDATPEAATPAREAPAPGARGEAPKATPPYWCKKGATREEMMAKLDEYGFCVVPRVLSEEDCKRMVDLMWKWLEEVTANQPEGLRVVRADESTHKNFARLGPLNGMLVQHWGIGHSELAWFARQHPDVVATSARLQGVAPEDLLASFDGASMGCPERTGFGDYNGKTRFHLDQSLTVNEHICTQGIVTAFEVRPGDATLTVLQGSHKHHGALAEAYLESVPEAKRRDNWLQLKPEHVAFYKARGCTEVPVEAPAGSVIYWDSRTGHFGREPITAKTPGHVARADPRERCVVYVCYLPRAGATAADLKKKRDAHAAGRTTSHWPYPARLFPERPSTWGRPYRLPEPLLAASTPATLTPLGRRLAGYDQ